MSMCMCARVWTRVYYVYWRQFLFFHFRAHINRSYIFIYKSFERINYCNVLAKLYVCAPRLEERTLWRRAIFNPASISTKHCFYQYNFYKFDQASFSSIQTAKGLLDRGSLCLDQSPILNPLSSTGFVQLVLQTPYNFYFRPGLGWERLWIVTLKWRYINCIDR